MRTSRRSLLSFSSAAARSNIYEAPGIDEQRLDREEAIFRPTPSQVADVRIVDEILRYVSIGHQVVLDLEDGQEVMVTSFCTVEPRR